MNWLRKRKIAALEKAYKRVGRLEQELGYPEEAMEMRARFFRETWRFVERQGGTRQQKRKARRDLVNGK